MVVRGSQKEERAGFIEKEVVKPLFTSQLLRSTGQSKLRGQALKKRTEKDINVSFFNISEMSTEYCLLIGYQGQAGAFTRHSLLYSLLIYPSPVNDLGIVSVMALLGGPLDCL